MKRVKHFMQEEILLQLEPYERESFRYFLDLYFNKLIFMGALLHDVSFGELSYEARRRIIESGLELWKNTKK